MNEINLIEGTRIVTIQEYTEGEYESELRFPHCMALRTYIGGVNDGPESWMGL